MQVREGKNIFNEKINILFCDLVSRSTLTDIEEIKLSASQSQQIVVASKYRNRERFPPYR